MTVKTNIGKEFLKIIDECFPVGNKMHKILNRNNVKVSYSCLPSMQQRHKRMNVGKLRREEEKEEDLTCKCREVCPLGGECKESELIYKANVSAEVNGGEEIKTYIGLTSTKFVERYRNHLQSFRNEGMRNSTELSKHIWDLKEKGISYNITWEIHRKAKAYRPGARYCNLCTAEALAIAFQAGENCLNSKNEILKQCRHRARWKLGKFKEF